MRLPFRHARTRIGLSADGRCCKGVRLGRDRAHVTGGRSGRRALNTRRATVSRPNPASFWPKSPHPAAVPRSAGGPGALEPSA